MLRTCCKRSLITYYSAASNPWLNSSLGVLYNLRSCGWLGAWLICTVHYVAMHCLHWETVGPTMQRGNIPSSQSARLCLHPIAHGLLLIFLPAGCRRLSWPEHIEDLQLAQGWLQVTRVRFEVRPESSEVRTLPLDCVPLSFIPHSQTVCMCLCVLCYSQQIFLQSMLYWTTVSRSS